MTSLIQRLSISLLLLAPLTAGCGGVMLRTGSPTFRAGVRIGGTVNAQDTASVAGDAYASATGIATATATATDTATVAGSAPSAHGSHGGGAVVVVDHGEAGGHQVVEASNGDGHIADVGGGVVVGGSGAVDADGIGYANGHADGHGHGDGHGHANGNGNGYASVNGNGNGNGYASGNGNGNGYANGNGNGHADANANVDVNVNVNATASATASTHLVVGGPVTLDASAAGRAPATTGRGPGVRGTAGGTAHLGAFLEGGLDVDGTLLGFADVGPLELGGGAEVDGRFMGDEALEAFLTVEHDVLPRDGGETRVTVRVRGAAPTEARAPVDIHLILDRSSSMQGSWSDAVDAAKILVAGLAPTDRIHIVAYGTRGEEVLPPRAVGDGALVRLALDRIRVGGGTNIEAGLEIAYREVRRAPSRFRGRSLVILVSDGVPNEGELGAEGLASMAGTVRAGRGCKTTVIGLGDQFDADILGAIAAEGRGGYYLARNAAELAPALTAELEAHASVAARDVELSLDLGAGAEVVHVFDGHAGTTTSDGRVVLSVPKLAAGEERRIVVRVQVAAGAAPRILTSARVSYRAGGDRRSASGESWMAFGASAQIAAGAGGWHAVEADLGEALAYAGRQVRYGNGEEAAARLRAHVRLASRHPGHQSAAPLGHRTTAVGRLATVLTALTGSASYQERRQVGLSLGALSVRFAR